MTAPCQGGVAGSCDAGDDQRRGGDRGDGGALVHRADRVAAARVALRGDLAKPVHDRADRAGFTVLERPGEPAVRGAVRDGAHALAADGRGALGPGQVQAGRRAAEREPRDPVRCVRGQPHADHAAEREPRVGGAGHLKRSMRREHAAAELFYGVRSRGRGAAVAGPVEPQQAEVPGQGAGLRVPHGPGGAERVAEDQDGQAVVALQRAVELQGGLAGRVRAVRHRRTPSPWTPGSGCRSGARRGRRPAPGWRSACARRSASIVPSTGSLSFAACSSGK